MNFWAAAAYSLALGLLLIIIRIFIKPLKTVSMLVLNSALGGAGLYIFNYFAAKVGMSIGINIVTAAICGLLGVPGLILLSAMKLIFCV